MPQYRDVVVEVIYEMYDNSKDVPESPTPCESLSPIEPRF